MRRLAENVQVVQPELKRARMLEREPVLLEDPRRGPRVEAMMLFERHAVHQA
jgi:hypothetical protein